MADGDDENEEEQNEEEQPVLLDHIPIVGESDGKVMGKPIHTGPLTDAEYNDLLVRQNETSLDALVRGVVTNDRTNMASIDQMARSQGNFRRWIPSKFNYKLVSEWEWVASKEGKVKLDAQGKPVPSRDEPKENKSRPKNDKIPYEKWPIKVDIHGKVVLEMEYPEPVCVKTLKRKWINPEEARRLIADGRRVITSEEEEKLRKEEKRKFTEDPEEYGPFLPLEYEGVIVTERLWFLSGAQTERNIIGPREAMTKLPKRVTRKFVDFLVDWQRDHPETPIKDFYLGMYPEKWLPKDQWVEIDRKADGFAKGLGQSFDENEPRLRLGNLIVTTRDGSVSLPNYYELGKIAEYYLGPLYFSAEVRFVALRQERRRIIREYRESHNGKEITARKLDKAIDKAYQWWLPYVQYQFVNKWIPGKVRLDKDPSKGLDRVITAAERADANFAAVNQISFIVVEPVQTGPGKVDLATAVIYFPINEEIRDIARMVGHFQQCKSQQWKFDMFTYEKSDVKAALSADHGGAMSGGKMKDDDVFALSEEKLSEWRTTLNLSEEEYQDLRKALLGAFHSRTLESKRLTGQEMYGEYGFRRVDVSDGAKTDRSAISTNREGGIVKFNDYTYETTLPGLRRYTRGHIQLLAGETYFWYDPWDIMQNNGGLKSEGMINAFVNRLGLYVSEVDHQPLIEIVDLMELLQDGSPEALAKAAAVISLTDRADREEVPVGEKVVIDWFNQTEIYRQLAWKQNKKPILARLEQVFEKQRKLKEVYVWPVIEKIIIDLPVPALLNMGDELDQIHEMCDLRIDAHAYMLGQGKDRGAYRGWSLSDSGHAVKTARYGARINRSRDPEVFKESQRAMSRMYDFGWRSGQIDKTNYWVRSIARRPDLKGKVGAILDDASSLMKSGVHPDFAIDGARVLLQRGWFGDLKLHQILYLQQTQEEKDVENYWHDKVMVPYFGDNLEHIIDEEMFYELLDRKDRLM